MSAMEEPQPQTISRLESALATLAYLGPLIVIAGLLSVDRPFVNYHVRQGLVLFAVLVIASFFVWLPMIGWVVPALVVVLCLVVASQAAVGHQLRLPVVSNIAERLQF